jgi:glycosyltransferase involved in cell wall biosynthesis
MKTVALIEPYQGGHHFTYLRLFTETLLNLGCRVMTFSQEPGLLLESIVADCPDWSDRLHAFEMFPLQPVPLPILGRVRTLPGVGPIPQLSGTLSRWKQAAKIVQTAAQQTGHEPNLVFFDWLDGYFSHYLTHHFIDLVFPYKWAGLYFRPGHLRYGERSLPVLKAPLAHYSLARSRNCHAIGVVDEWVVDKLQRGLKAPVIPFPDFTDETAPDPNYELVNQIRKKAGGRKIIGLVGALSKRKGVVTLLKVAQQAAEKNWFFVIVGALSEHQFHQDYGQRFPEEYAWVKSVADFPPENCFFHLNHIPEESQFNALIKVCDVVFAAYENFPYSSNILTKAAVFQKPVVASQKFCMGKRVEHFQVGLTIPEGNVTHCIEALQHLLTEDSPVTTDLSFDFKGLRALHCADRLQDSFKAVLEPTKLQQIV